MSIPDNLARIRERISVAATRSGRNPADVRLMAVSKTFPADAIRQAHDARQRLFGENRVQEFAGKAESLRDLPGFEMHLIGHLQSNKARKAAELFAAIDSVDSLRLAERLNASAADLGRELPVLIEINIGGEEVKSGVAANSAELDQLLTAAPLFKNLRIRGLMTVPPFTEEPEGARPFFRRLRELRDQIAARNLPGVTMDELSMGMSHDFEVAIEEGSTCVRIGTAIFGARDYA
jgi:pyridoxal phosphate enzyme (YggS family)